MQTGPAVTEKEGKHMKVWQWWTLVIIGTFLTAFVLEAFKIPWR